MTGTIKTLLGVAVSCVTAAAVMAVIIDHGSTLEATVLEFAIWFVATAVMMVGVHLAGVLLLYPDKICKGPQGERLPGEPDVLSSRILVHWRDGAA